MFYSFNKSLCKLDNFYINKSYSSIHYYALKFMIPSILSHSHFYSLDYFYYRLENYFYYYFKICSLRIYY